VIVGGVDLFRDRQEVFQIDERLSELDDTTADTIRLRDAFGEFGHFWPPALEDWSHCNITEAVCGLPCR
jgi:hypothetical protein